MANEQRLIDANKLMERLTNWKLDCLEHSDFETASVLDDCMCELDAQPIVDAVVLPCKIGDDVYIIPSKVNFDLNVLSRHKEHNRVYHQNVAAITFKKNCWYMTGSADAEYGTGEILLDRYYKETWFLTREEAEAALDRMKG